MLFSCINFHTDVLICFLSYFSFRAKKTDAKKTPKVPESLLKRRKAIAKNKESIKKTQLANKKVTIIFDHP